MLLTFRVLLYLVWWGLIVLVARHWHLGFWPIFWLVVIQAAYDGACEGLKEER